MNATLSKNDSFDPDMSMNDLKDEANKAYQSESSETHTWEPFKGLRVDTYHFRKKNDISIFSDAKFRGGVFNLSTLDVPVDQKASESFM